MNRICVSELIKTCQYTYISRGLTVAQVNLQAGAGMGAGAHNVLHQPMGTRFDQVS